MKEIKIVVVQNEEGKCSIQTQDEMNITEIIGLLERAKLTVWEQWPREGK